MGVMGAYGPEILNMMRDALDEAWALLSDEHKAVTSKSDMAQRILGCASEGERDPARLRAAALIGTGIDRRIDRLRPESSK
jgi:hypothetical protein